MKEINTERVPIQGSRINSRSNALHLALGPTAAGWQPRPQPCHTSTDLSPVPIDHFECKAGSPYGIRFPVLVIPCGSKGAVPRTSWRLVANVNQIQMTLWKGDTPQKRMV